MAAHSDPGSPDVEGPELNRSELLTLNPFELPSFSREKIRYMAVFDVEKWAAALEGLTFATACAPVGWDEGLAVQHFYQQGCCGHRGKVTGADEAALQRLRQRVAGLLAELAARGHAGPYFVRLGPRSPKDAPMMASEPWGFTEARLRAALQEAAAGVGAGDDPEPGPQEVLHRFQTVCSSLLQVACADDAMRLFVSSSRVMQDIAHTRDHGESHWDVSVVARAWDPEVRLEREFRAFVAGGELTAVTQYDDQLCYGGIAPHAEGILGAIARCFRLALPGLERLGLTGGTASVVVDFLVVPPAGDGAQEFQARIVELNPFGPMTGASLFTWEGDRRLLQGGRDLYGDLEAWELRHPPGVLRLPSCVEECTVGGVAFRFLKEHPPGLDWSKLEAFWGDYLRLAPPALLGRAS